MALNIPMPESPGTSLIQGLDTGSSMMSRIMQPIIERERLKQQKDQFIQNMLLRKQALSQKESFDYLRAKIMEQKLKQGSPLEGPARYAADLDKLKNQYGADSEVYKNAKAAYDAQIDAKNDLSDLRARTKKGLRPGETEFFDEKTGKALGKEIPLSEKDRESEQGNILFNELYPIVYKGASPFSGEGSINRLQQAAANYKIDPKARQLFDDYLLSIKMLGATTVNEASTLRAGRTNRTYSMLRESLESQDIPRIIQKLIREYNIPSSANLNAGMRYQKALSDARQKAKKLTPATQKLFYDPEMQAQHEQKMNNDELPSSNENINNARDVIVIDPKGKKFKTTKENAAHLPAGWKRG